MAENEMLKPVASHTKNIIEELKPIIYRKTMNSQMVEWI